MTKNLDRRQFCKTAGLGATALFLPPMQGAPVRRLKIGHTGITWGYSADDVVPAIEDVAGLGYHGFESFGHILEAWEAKGGIGRVFEANRLPLVSAYCGMDLMDSTKRADEVKKMVRYGKLIKKYGGTVLVIGPNGVKRAEYDFKQYKTRIAAALNEASKALTDIDVVPAWHQHTDTCIETAEEVYGVMEAVDTRYVKFSPDVGQLLKGGGDPVKIVSDFVNVICHVHLKDWNGGPESEGYCPLGMGKVNLPAVIELLEKSSIKAMIMVELDPLKEMRIAARRTAEISKAYLQKLGYTFR